MLSLLLLCLSSVASAASPWVMPEGSSTIYGGTGVSTFHIGLSGLTRDRQVQTRVVGYGAVGLPGKIELSMSLPLQSNFVIEDPDEGPCPSGEYCSTTSSLGTVVVQMRRQVLSGVVPLALGVGLHADPWNSSTRGRWTNVGQGVFGAGLTAAMGSEREYDSSSIGANLSAGWWPSLGRTAVASSGATRRAPVGPVVGSLELWFRKGPITLTTAAHGTQRLGGLVFGNEWVREWRQTQDLWSVTGYGELRVEGKVSWAFADNWGLHTSASRSAVVRAGPPDMWDVSIGVHRYRAPKAR